VVPVRVSVIVPATNGPPTLEQCTAAVAGGEEAPDELLVVAEPRDANPARARNIGARKAAGDVLVFVDADVQVHPCALRRIRAAFLADPELTALFGAYDDAPADASVVSWFRNLLHHHVHHQNAGPATTFWTGLGAVRRDAFFAAGGFDERLDWLEDIDLGMRLTAAGGRILLDPRIQGKHLKRWSFTSMLRTDFTGRAIPWTLLMLRSGSSSAELNLGWRHRLSAIVSIAAATAAVTRRTPTAAVAAGTLVALNQTFYALLLRRGGPARAGAGVGLHVLHHLTAASAVPVAVAIHLITRRNEHSH
jgi:glycosyl transferase family 2